MSERSDYEELLRRRKEWSERLRREEELRHKELLAARWHPLRLIGRLVAVAIGVVIAIGGFHREHTTMVIFGGAITILGIVSIFDPRS